MTENLQESFDIVILDGDVLRPDARGFHKINIGIRKDRIESVTTDKISGTNVIDAGCLVVSPGFVDVHTHVDLNPYAAICEARMGVTTSVGNNCGMGIYPLSLFEELVSREDFPINQALLVGHQNLRETLGHDDRYAPLDSSKIDALRQLADRALAAGAIGVSFGLAYIPGTSSDELNAIARVVADHKSILTAHPRHAAHGLPGIAPDAVQGEEELISAVRSTGARLQISHLGSQIAWKADPYDDLLIRGLARIQKARDDGVDVMADCHPYDAWCTNIGGAAVDPFQLEAFREHYDLGFDIMQIADGPYRGKRVTEESYGRLREEAPNTHVIGYTLREDLALRTIASPFVMVASDSAFAGDTGLPSHPRCCGTFPRTLRLMVREHKLLSLEETLFKMTLMPAERFGLPMKGRIEEGADADIVMFDADTVADLATYMEPDQPCVGIQHVIVNGVPIIQNGSLTDKRPGRYLLSGC